MKTIAITLATQVEVEGFCRPETLLFTQFHETIMEFEQRIFRSLLSHRIVQEVWRDENEFDLELYVSVIGFLEPDWMLEIRRLLKKSFNKHSISLTDNWVY